jgi:hypothetical protein
LKALFCLAITCVKRADFQKGIYIELSVNLSSRFKVIILIRLCFVAISIFIKFTLRLTLILTPTDLTGVGIHDNGVE